MINSAQMKSVADRVRAHDHEVIMGIVDIGRTLIEAKKNLTLDQFNAWALSECGLTVEQARALIFAASSIDLAIEMTMASRGAA